jgi:excisionase family DNA binding protein
VGIPNPGCPMTAICPPIPLLERLAVSPIEAAGLLSVSKRTVARLLASGKIKAAKLGSRVLVDVPSLKALLADQPTNTDAAVIKRPRSSRGRFTHVRRKGN